MIITKDDVLKVARLSRIELSRDELDLFSGQLETVLEFIEKLKKVDIQSVQPMSHALDIRNVLRPDVAGESLPNTLVLKNAPESLKGHFRVPKVIE